MIYKFNDTSLNWAIFYNSHSGSSNNLHHMLTTTPSQPLRYSIRFIALLLLFVTVSSELLAQAGKDGPRTITAANTLVNSYASIRPAGGGNGTVTLTAGAKTITHAADIILLPGDLVMIIQTQGGSGFSMSETVTSSGYGNITAYGSAGAYEFRVVESVPSATSFTIIRGLTNTYTSTTDTGWPGKKRACPGCKSAPILLLNYKCRCLYCTS